MQHVFGAIVPGWKGRTIPASWPRHVLVALHLSLIVVDLLALVRHARTFSLLSPHRREELLCAMAAHRWAWMRQLVRWWKHVALVTSC